MIVTREGTSVHLTFETVQDMIDLNAWLKETGIQTRMPIPARSCGHPHKPTAKVRTLEPYRLECHSNATALQMEAHLLRRWPADDCESCRL